ncbi:ATP-dependent sacrificial sulfur transferase LarE [Desulfosarcina sp.]|uniref:ATP-dependent sacrificial sulfur transferase LarE n=1 Tax=Desulfosarcina sp. TaxID=2027861 RepID=UPI0039708B07
MQISLKTKTKCLARILRQYDHLAVALSGGVDSAVLLAEAHAVMGNRVTAVTARSPIHPHREVADAIKIANTIGVPHLIVDSSEIEQPDFLANTPQRCYICKKAVFGHLLARVREKGIQHLAHGANLDDLGDYRPGLEAARELGVAAPLMDAGFTKEDIRQVARDRGLFVWDKPAMACIATRFPYGMPISLAKVEQVKKAEEVLAAAGLVGCRVRHHGDVARIEVPVDKLRNLVADPLRSRIVDQLKDIGFLHVCTDLEGYVSGSLNRALDIGNGRGSSNP